MRKLLRTFKIIVMFLIKLMLFAIPKNKKLIAFSSWFGNQYADNTKYLYEYLLKNENFKVIWLTRSKDVLYKLKKDNKPVAMMNTPKGVWKQIRAFALISTIQLSDFNPFFLCNCYYVDLDHGIPYKRAGFDIDKSNLRIKERNEKRIKRFIRYYSTATSYLSALMIKSSYHTELKSILLCGKPRNDLFFNEYLQDGLNEELRNMVGSKKTIVYMPTHRECGKNCIQIDELFNLQEIEKICEQREYIFIIKKHFYHKTEKTDLHGYKNIVDITNWDNIDSQMLLVQTNILISDYSSVCSEFLLLDRPIIHYAYDYDWYQKNERGIFLPIDKMSFGKVVFDKESLTDALVEAIDGEGQSDIKRSVAKRVYFDDSIDYRFSSEMVTSYLKRMQSGEKIEFDWSPFIKKVDNDLQLKNVKELFLKGESN